MRAADRLRARRGQAVPTSTRATAPRRVGDEAEGALVAAGPSEATEGPGAGEDGGERAPRETSRGWQQ